MLRDKSCSILLKLLIAPLEELDASCSLSEILVKKQSVVGCERNTMLMMLDKHKHIVSNKFAIISCSEQSQDSSLLQ